MINSNCQTNSSPEECTTIALRKERDSHADELIRLSVLTFGWGNCSNRYLKTNDWAEKAESMRKALEMNFRRRLKMKAFPCAD